MQPKFTRLRQPLIFAAVGCLLILSARPGLSQTEEPRLDPGRHLTDADVDPSVCGQIDHSNVGKWTITETNTVVPAMRKHVLDTDYGLQKESGYRFMAIRRGIREKVAGSFNLLGDLAANPDKYCGHPIVLFGRVDPEKVAAKEDGTFQASLITTSGQPQFLAQVEFQYYESDYDEIGLKPVVVCGYLVRFKQAEDSTLRLPFFVAQRLEWVRPNLTFDDLKRVEHRSRGIPESEAGTYYETLKRARLLSLESMRQAALANRDARIKGLLSETKRQGLRMTQRAELHRAANPEDSAGYAQLTREAEDYLSYNSKRYEKYAKEPSKFPMFVDVFKNPDAWKGRMVTMTGRVRKVNEYPPDEDDLGIGMLYEFWLYTDDSQRNPAVFVCTSKPGNLPKPDRNNVIENVTITGYFFKLYRYTAQDAHRLAPMLLGQTVTWAPQADVTQEAFPGWLKTLTMAASIFGFIALMIYLANNHEGDRQFRQKIQAGNLSSAPLNLEIVDDSLHVARESIPLVDQSSGATYDNEMTSVGSVSERPVTRSNLTVAATYEPESDHWIGRERIVGKKIRTVLRLAPAKREIDEHGIPESPTVVVLKNGYRFELAESELRPVGGGIETGRLSRMKQRGSNKTERFLDATITDVMVDQLSNVYLILDADRYLSAHDLPQDDSVRAPLLSALFDRREVAFADYWDQTPVSRTQLRRRGTDTHLLE